ncbi:MAG: DUF167 domain-containing protein [Candidatus Electrothrix sp. YB6]
MSYLQVQSDGSLLLSLYVQPRSARNEIAGLHGDAVKLRLTAPPVDGKANKAVITFLAKCFKIPKSAVQIRSGQQSRIKKILLNSVEEERVRSLLEQEL